MHDTHERAEYSRWVRQRVEQARMEAADPSTQWAEQSQIEADTEAQKRRIGQWLDKYG